MLPFTVVAAVPLYATDPDRETRDSSVERYAVTAWTSDKLPGGDVLAMTQDRAGFLWLGTSRGLVRSDGFQFLLWGDRHQQELPNLSINALISARDGSLWLGLGGRGAICQIQTSEAVACVADESITSGGVTALLEDRTGTIWAGGHSGLAQLRTGRWSKLTADQGLPRTEVYALYEDSRGALWVGTSEGVFRRPSRDGLDRFTLFDAHANLVQSFAEDGSGAMWATDPHRVARNLTTAPTLEATSVVRLPAAGWRLLRDHLGRVWVAGEGAGLLRIQSPFETRAPRLINPSYAERITGSVRSIFEDRESNIWVGVRGGGLLRVSERVIATDTPLDGVTNDGVRALTASADGSVWVATSHSLNRFLGERRQTYALPETMSLMADEQGGLLAVTAQRLVRVRDQTLSVLPQPEHVRLEWVKSVTADSHGALWLCSMAQGLVHWQHGVVRYFDHALEFTGRPCNFAYADSKDRIWIGFVAGGVALYNNGQAEVFDEKEGLASGSLMGIYEDKGGTIWITTTDGISRFSNQRFSTIGSKNGLPGKIVPSIVEDLEGYLWVGVNSGSGIVRFNPEEVDRAAADGKYQVQHAFYDLTDGLQGDLNWYSRPGAIRGGDGRLWFTTGRGVVVIDPRHLTRAVQPTVLRIERAVAGGSAFTTAARPSLPPRTSTIQIDYTAVSMSSAAKLRFRYLLEGLDTQWVSAGQSRRAVFENLPPGHYRFRVTATDDGMWNKPEVAWEFSIRPPFRQTRTFYALCILSGVSAIWGIWWLRMRALRNQFTLVAAERVRISRDIHDTLLQSLAAVGMKLEVVASQLDASQAPASLALRRLRREVGQCIVDARQSVWELRAPRLESRTLAETINEMAEQVRSDRPIRIEVVTNGRPDRTSRPELEEQFLRVSQEALGNAIRHGGAGSVRIELDYGPDAVTLRITDDGCGFVVQDAEQCGGDHWGVTNMKERALRIGGRLSIVSSPGRGASIELTAPIFAGR